MATGAYSGNAPFAPGTFGTLAGLPVCLVLSFFKPWIAFLAVTGLIVFAVWVSQEASAYIGEKDPGCIVIDEIAGLAVTLLLFPFTLKTAILGFVFFRFFDILKPFPVGFLDREIDGGAGIVLDDVAAGMMAHIVLRMIFQVTGF